MERRASTGKPSRRRERAWKGKPAPPWKSNREPRNALRDLLGGRGVRWGCLGEPTVRPGTLGDLLGSLGDALGDRPGTRERLKESPGRPWGWLGGPTDSPGTPWGTCWEALGTPWGINREPGNALGHRLGSRGTPWQTNRGLGNASGNLLESLGDALADLLGKPGKNLGRTSWRDLQESTCAARALRLTFF